MRFYYSMYLGLLFTALLSSKLVYTQMNANFSAELKEGCAPVLIKFKDSSSGNPVYWKWDLGNGTTSFLQNPSVTYFNPGLYTIKLFVRNANGLTDSIVKQQFIKIYAPPLLQFKASDSAGCFPLAVQFSDLSVPGSGNIVEWLWDFGDGITSTQQHPAHTYNALGNYNVSLQATNSSGCKATLSKANFIKLQNGVLANFKFTAPNNCKPPASVSFTNQSTGTGSLTYQWRFGDGTTSNQYNPVHTYTLGGTYTITLLVSNNTGCTDSMVQTNAITIGTVKASFVAPSEICRNTLFTINNTSSPAPVSATWNFGDGTTSDQLQPEKKYSNPGNYTITLISDFGACKDMATASIIVKPSPVPQFNGTNLLACTPPLTSNFVHQTAGVSGVKWYFGDGDSATTNHPSHTYTKFGKYTVTLITYGMNGCIDTLKKNDFVIIEKPEVHITNLPKEGCVPMVFTPQVSSSFSLTSWLWDFGEGTTSTLSNPVHTYSKSGTYTVKLYYQAGVCSDSVIYINKVEVGEKPQIQFEAQPRFTCAFYPVQFNNLSTGNSIKNYLWSFGDGGSSTEKEPSHIYQDTGKFTVTLIVNNNGCKDSLVLKDYVQIKPPVAKFTDSLSCVLPARRYFKDKSIGATQWNWDFGDGNFSTVQNPVHDYNNAGNYTVKLMVKNDTCEHFVESQVVIIEEAAAFETKDTVVCKGAPVLLKGIHINTKNISSWQWNFGDGTIMFGSDTVHYRYTRAGTYTVTLIVTDLNGCADTLSKLQYIRVHGPTALFTGPSHISCENKIITFKDASTGDGTFPVTSWTWNYGDGVTDTLYHPPFQHFYNNAGSYDVVLTVTDSKGCADSLRRNAFVFISKPKPAFNTIDTLSCPDKNVKFNNTSLGAGPLNFNWYFGDNTQSNVSQPVHQYSMEGLYSVKLVLQDRYGCLDSLEKYNYISIQKPVPFFTVNDSVATCPPLVVNFVNASQHYVQLEWDFGDNTKSALTNPTHFYNVAGTYFAKLIITSAGGCKDSMIKKIVVRGPQGSFKYDAEAACIPSLISFKASTKDNTTFIWDYNDGTTDATSDSMVTHQYTLPGFYLPKMILVDPQGCKVAIPGTDTIKVYAVNALFASTNKILCDSGIVTFSNKSISNDSITSFQWKFGDGGVSALKDPSHFYTKTGSFPVELITTTALGCKDTATLNVPVLIVSSPSIGMMGSDTACVPATLQYNSVLLQQDTMSLSWNWNFGNGITSTAAQPNPVLYAAAGNYQVSLIATNAGGCADTVQSHSVIHPLPLIAAGNDVVLCRGKTLKLEASGGISYLWQPSPFLSCLNCAAPVVNADSSNWFYVQGRSAAGCTNKDSVLVTVQQPIDVKVNKGDTLCEGEKIQLMATGADSYTWLPLTGLNNSTIPNPIAAPTGTVVYEVIGKDKNACFEDTGFVKLEVFKYPTINAGEDKTLTVGDQVNIYASGSPDISHVEWKPSAGLNCLKCLTPVANPKQTTTYIVTVTNEGGCVAKDAVTVFVVCKEGNVFVPNTFSPNGDGSNEHFYPRGKGLFSIKSFKVFNRWGELVFENQNFSANSAEKGWNGMFKGKQAAAEVYVYVLEVLCENSAVLIFKGDVTLIR